jgi:hypothetical protein
MTATCPECEQGKTVNCVGVALDFEADEFVPCATVNTASLLAGLDATRKADQEARDRRLLGGGS